MVALLLILALMAARPAAARADAVPDADGGRGVPGPRGDLLVLKLAPAAAARAWGAVPGRGQAAWLRATGVAGLGRAAAALGGAWFEPEVRGDAPRRGGKRDERGGAGGGAGGGRRRQRLRGRRARLGLREPAQLLGGDERGGLARCGQRSQRFRGARHGGGGGDRGAQRQRHRGDEHGVARAADAAAGGMVDDA